MARTVSVNLSGRTYEVEFVGLSEVWRQLPANAVVITDENLVRFYGEQLSDWPHLVLPAGESTKSFEQYRSAVEWCCVQRLKRDSLIVAFGGGVIGDLAGFVAATYMRGVDLLQIPTSLLAMVDSSVGGKVGIDLPAGKNLLGSFHQPEKVFIPVEALVTLPERHFRNGMAEVVKYGLIMDRAFADKLSTELVEAQSQALPELIQHCVDLKARVVALDEFDLTGQRAILNFGHTIGHAIETVTGYEAILHGEAVAIGMAIEAKIGESLGLSAPGTADYVVELLRMQGLPHVLPPDLDLDRLLEVMALDKKADRRGLSFSFLTKPGQCKLVQAVPVEPVRAVLSDA